MPQKSFALKDILPNPFRRIERYEIKREKVDALVESIKATGFWDNLVGRRVNGDVEIAYGHHRLVALKEVLGAREEIAVNIRPLDDNTMYQIMARENMEEWGSSAWVEMETVAAAVQGYADGRLTLPAPNRRPGTELRYAPSFRPISSTNAGDAEGAKPYNAQTVAVFLGWVEPNGQSQLKVRTALAALELIEEGVLTERQFRNLGTMEATKLVKETRTAMAAHQARQREHEETAAREAKRAEEARQAAERAKKVDDEKRARAALAQAAAAEQKARDAREDAQGAAHKAKAEGKQHGAAVSAVLRDPASKDRGIEARMQEAGIAKHLPAARAAVAEQERKKHEDRPREVREFTDAIKAFRDALYEAKGAARHGKFSPEAKQYVQAQFKLLRKLMEEVFHE